MDLTPFKELHSTAEFNELDNFVIIEDAYSRETILYNKAYTDELKRLNGKKPAFDERFLSVDSYLTDIEGRYCVVEVYEKVFPKTLLSYDPELRTTISHIEGEMRREIQVDFISGEGEKRNHDLLLDRVVRMTIDYYEVPYAQLLTFDIGNTHEGTLLQYERYGSENPTPTHVKVKEYWDNSFTNFFSRGFSLLCENMQGFAAFDTDLYEKFVSLGIKRILIVPFFIEGSISGFLVLSNPKMIADSFDFFLADFAGNAVGTLIYRGRLYESLYFDSLTKLPWNSSMEVAYGSFLDTHEGSPIAIMALDISRFRMITRSYGTKKGDELLVAIAGILKRKYPKSLISRKFGSDEFYIITTGLAENLKIEAQHINAEIRNLFPEMLISMSFGIYQVKDRSEPLASAALKVVFAHSQAKENPFQSAVIFDNAMSEAEAHDQFLTDRFRKAIENKEFKVYVQPRYNLESSSYYSGEALIRWEMDGKLVFPGEFIPLFESNGLCRDLDMYVLEEVCALQAKLLVADPSNVVPISVNYSRNDFSDDSIFEHTIAVINEYKIPANLIEIEITESAYVDFEERIINFIEKCHAAGIKVLMDDFGSGISSFNSLKNLDVDSIKLDTKFLSRSGSSEKRRKIIESIIDLSRSLGIPMVVEGVEEESDAGYFRAHGVRYVQGYLFGKAIPMDDFAKLANKRAEVSIGYGAIDPKMMLNEAIDAKSNLRLIIERLPIPAGIYRFNGKTMMALFLNRKAIDAISEIGSYEHFVAADLLSTLSEKSRKGALACLRGDKELYAFSETRQVTFVHGVDSLPYFVSSMLIRKEGDTSYFILLASPNHSDGNSIPTNPFTRKEYDELIRGTTDIGYILSTQAGEIVTFNDRAKELYPDVKIGQSVTKILGKDYPRMPGKRRFYNVQDNSLRTVQISHVTIDGEIHASISSSIMAEGKPHLLQTYHDGFDFFDRAVASVEGVARYYIEINLDEDRYLRAKLSDLEKGEKPYASGPYRQGLYPTILKLVSEVDRPAIAKRLNEANLLESSRVGEAFEIDFKAKGKDRYSRLHIRTFFQKGRHYATIYVLNVTELHMKNYDALTGLLTRNAGFDLMNRYIAQHPLNKMALAVMDLNGFKALNDTYGHPIGDKLLAEMKDAFATLPESYGVFTRLGGDEFCLLIRDRPKKFSHGETRALINASLAQCGKKAGLDHDVTASIGFALIPEDGSKVESIYGIADQDLYVDKKQSKKKGSKK